MPSADLYHPELFMMIDPGLSRDDVKKLPMAERRRLVADNPVLAALHYEARSKATFDYLLNGRRKPLGTIIERKRRIDDQRGGSSHEHDMLAIAELMDLPEWLSDEQRWHLVRRTSRGHSARIWSLRKRATMTQARLRTTASAATTAATATQRRARSARSARPNCQKNGDDPPSMTRTTRRGGAVRAQPHQHPRRRRTCAPCS